MATEIEGAHMYDAAIRQYLLHPQAQRRLPTLKKLNFPTQQERHEITRTRLTHLTRLTHWDVIGKTSLSPDSPLYVRCRLPLEAMARAILMEYTEPCTTSR